MKINRTLVACARWLRSHLENLNYNHLFYFHVVAETGSLGAAARRLSVTKPTISTQVRQLETFLGEPLFDRRGGRLRLNDAGERAHRYTRTMFEAGRALVHQFRGEPASDPSMLRVGVAPSVSRVLAREFFVPLLSLEDSSLRIRAGEGNALRRSLQAGELDLVIAENEPDNADALGIGCAAISDRRMLGVVGVDGPAGDLAEVLAEVPLFHYPDGSAERWAIEQYLRGEGIEASVVGQTDDATLLLELASTGRCVAFVPDTVARYRLQSDRLRSLAEVPRLRKRVIALFAKQPSSEMVERAIGLLQDAGGR